MTFTTADLLHALTTQTEHFIQRAEAFRDMPITALTQRPHAEAWNVLECLEHLNLYGDHYLPAIEQQMNTSRGGSAAPTFQPGLLGNYMTESMLPKGKLNKMKTFASKNPLNQPLDKAVIDRFLAQQTHLLALLQRAYEVNLNTVRVKTTLPLLWFSMGDTLRFVIAHQARHFEQMEGVLGGIPVSTRHA